MYFHGIVLRRNYVHDYVRQKKIGGHFKTRNNLVHYYVLFFFCLFVFFFPFSLFLVSFLYQSFPESGLVTRPLYDDKLTYCDTTVSIGIVAGHLRYLSFTDSLRLNLFSLKSTEVEGILVTFVTCNHRNEYQ